MSKNLSSKSKRDPLGLRNPADIARWCSYSLWSLQEAVTLLLGFEPNLKFTSSFYSTSEFDEIYKCLKNDISVESGHSPHEVDWPKVTIEPQAFVKWAEAFFDKSIYLPVQVNSEDQRIAEYTVNLAKMKACLVACSNKEQKKEVIDCGFEWTEDKTVLGILHEKLIQYKFIENITYVKFNEAFCVSKSSTKIIWLSTVVALRYLLDELKNKEFIENDDFCAQAEKVFQQRRKKELAEIRRKTLYVSAQWSSTDTDKKDEQKLIDIIMNDLINGVVPTKK